MFGRSEKPFESVCNVTKAWQVSSDLRRTRTDRSPRPALTLWYLCADYTRVNMKISAVKHSGGHHISAICQWYVNGGCEMDGAAPSQPSPLACGQGVKFHPTRWDFSCSSSSSGRLLTLTSYRNTQDPCHPLNSLTHTCFYSWISSQFCHKNDLMNHLHSQFWVLWHHNDEMHNV